MEVGPKGARIPIAGQHGPEGSAGGCFPAVLQLSAGLRKQLYCLQTCARKAMQQLPLQLA